jgi:preprotein translocase subunit SecD
MFKTLLICLTSLVLTLTLAQIELEFAPPKGTNAPPAILREARHVLQQRLEHFLSGQKFTVRPGTGKILVKLESSENIEAVIELCTAIGKLEFIDSDVFLESGETFTGSCRVVFTDKDIRNVSASMSEVGGAVVELELSPEGSDKLASYSQKNIGRFLVIVKDEVVLSSPKIAAEISGGVAQISEHFTLEEANLLATQLTGRLPIPLEFIR